MVSKTCVFLVVYVALFVIIQTLFPQVSALKRISDVDEFMVEDMRTHMRQNYVVQKSLENDVSYDSDNIGPEYAGEPPPARSGPGALSDQLIDYADMIRNDIILLDNSVETRTRKTGNIKVKKQHSQILDDVPCYCEHRSVNVNLSKIWGIVYPQSILNITCESSNCKRPFTCKESIYNITILTRRSRSITDDFEIRRLKKELGMPGELVPKWEPKTIPITTECLCRP